MSIIADTVICEQVELPCLRQDREYGNLHVEMVGVLTRAHDGFCVLRSGHALCVQSIVMWPLQV